MSRAAFFLGPIALAFVAATGCAAPSDDAEVSADDVTVDTSTALARRQYDANVAFASSYRARCRPSSDRLSGRRPRVLVTGYGRFQDIADNASGRIVSALVPGARYPETTPPARGAIDPPEAQLSVATTTMNLPGVGEVDVCGMILPVYWDLAAIIVARELDAFAPSFVMMNGVASSAQPLWLELGAMNEAVLLEDGSNLLRPVPDDGRTSAPVLEEAPHNEYARPNLLSWSRVKSAAENALAAQRAPAENASSLAEIAPGVAYAGFPRSSNTYLCNDLTYVTGYLMDYPRQTVKLLRASEKVSGAKNNVKVTLQRDFRSVPRVFVHWPSALADARAHHASGASVMRAMIAAQLGASARGELPTRGDTRWADPSLAADAPR